MGKGDKHLPESNDRLVVAAQSAGAVFATIAAAVGGWIGYSALGINHRAKMPDAIEADRRTFVSKRAGRISYYSDRSADGGTPLVLLHSINAAASAFEMRPLFEYYRNERPVYAIDLPGFGFSDRGKRRYSPSLYIDSIIEFLETQVKNGPADVVALSLSSEFAATAALERPELFHSLTMISPTGFSAKKSIPEAKKAEQLYKGFAFPLWSQAFYDALVSAPSLKYFLKKSFHGPVETAMVDYAYATGHQPGARYAPLHFISGKLFTRNIYEHVYEKLELPVLVIYDQDAYSSFERLVEIVVPRPNWHTERIEPTRGLPHWEQLLTTAHTIDRVLGPTMMEQPSPEIPRERHFNRSNRRSA